MTFVIYASRPIKYIPRVIWKYKKKEIKARDIHEAISFFHALYDVPNRYSWNINMAWPKSIIKDGKYIQL